MRAPISGSSELLTPHRAVEELLVFPVIFFPADSRCLFGRGSYRSAKDKDGQRFCACVRGVAQRAGEGNGVSPSTDSFPQGCSSKRLPFLVVHRVVLNIFLQKTKPKVTPSPRLTLLEFSGHFSMTFGWKQRDVSWRCLGRVSC